MKEDLERSAIKETGAVSPHPFSACKSCPRACGALRVEGALGYCHAPAAPMLARAALHFYEEPCISGTRGSGAVFFSGCSLHCIYCQNQEISTGRAGTVISKERLIEIFFELEEAGAQNINLVTPTHYTDVLIETLGEAKERGLSIPIVYNCGGYESVESLERLDGLVDIYLTDYKYADSALASAFSNAPDYPETAFLAIREMVRQTGPCVFDEAGMLKRGVIVRELLLPGHVKNSKDAVKRIYEAFGDQIFFSLMNQYTPMRHFEKYPELSRKCTRREYERLLDFALGLGIKNAFIQEGGTAKESFIPAFDNTGVTEENR